jgi:HTH-type transcriptional regulator / antitoxin HigA
VYQAQEDSYEADEMKILVTLIEAYEIKHYPISVADPIEAIKFRVAQQGLSQKDLDPFIGSSGSVF